MAGIWHIATDRQLIACAVPCSMPISSPAHVRKCRSMSSMFSPGLFREGSRFETFVGRRRERQTQTRASLHRSTAVCLGYVSSRESHWAHAEQPRFKNHILSLTLLTFTLRSVAGATLRKAFQRKGKSAQMQRKTQRVRLRSWTLHAMTARFAGSREETHRGPDTANRIKRR